MCLFRTAFSDFGAHACWFRFCGFFFISAHRLGQKRVVKVFRMIVQDTIEAYQFKTSLVKSQLANSVIDDLDEEALFSSSEIKNMAAMLAINRDFANMDGRVEEANVGCENSAAVLYEIEENVENIMEASARDHAVFSGSRDCLLGDDNIGDADDVDIDPEKVKFRKPTTLGLCDDDDVVSESEAESEELPPDAPAAPAFDAEGLEMVGGNDVSVMTETQDVDCVLMGKDVASRVVVSTNQSKYKSRPTLLKRGKKAGGLNGGVGAVDQVDLDEEPEIGDAAGEVGLGMNMTGSSVRRAPRERNEDENDRKPALVAKSRRPTEPMLKDEKRVLDAKVGGVKREGTKLMGPKKKEAKLAKKEAPSKPKKPSKAASRSTSSFARRRHK